YHGTTSFRGLHNSDVLQLSGRQRAMFGRDEVYELLPEYWLIKVNSFDDIAKDTLDEWVYFLKNEEIRDDFRAKGLEKAKEELDIMKLSEEERRIYEAYQEDLHFQASMTESTWTAAKMEGREEGRKEGEAAGRREEKKAIALNLLQSSQLDTQKIAAMTGLTVEEVEGMKSEQ
ncbi:MAG: hypothetical protein D3904_10300, partial [Candidatus Electrothrix sp. EH2]|nr:hypothetical protein [Candidatus Electrothrix sp. EH2]